MSTDHTALDAVIAALGIEYIADFVPFSKSRNAAEKHPSINWRVHLTKGRITLDTDYSQGYGHLPKNSNQGFPVNTVGGHERIVRACETGRGGPMGVTKVQPPELRDVLYSLVMDAGAVDSASFEDWASEYGYDTDSRKAEDIYKACLSIGLKLRNMIGDAALSQLRDAFQDY